MSKSKTILDIRDYSLLTQEQEELFASFVDIADQTYDQIICSISQRYIRDPDWWASITASRNTYVSGIHQAVRWLMFLDELAKRDQMPEVVITDSQNLARMIRAKYAGHCKVQIEFTAQPILQKIASAIRAVLYELKSMGNGILARRRNAATGLISRNKPLTLLKSYLRHSAFSEGEFYDEFFPGLEQVLSKNQYAQITRMPVWNDYKNLGRLIQKCRNSEHDFLIKEDFLGLDDYIFAYMHRFRIAKIISEPIVFEAWDFAPLVRSELKEFASVNYVIEALLSYRFVMKAHRMGLKIRTVVSWFEGQPSDKCFQLGMSMYYENVKTVGYLGAAPRAAYRCCVPISFEATAKVCPTSFALTGEAYLSIYHGAYDPKNLSLAPNFRAAAKAKCIRAPKKDQVLVVFSAGLSATRQLIQSVLQLTQVPLLKDIKFVLKAHPTHHDHILSELLNGFDEPNVEMCEGELSTAMSEAILVLGVGTNSLLEAAFEGIPVVIDATKWWLLQEDPLPLSCSIPNYFRCTSVDEMVDAIVKTSLSDIDTKTDKNSFVDPHKFLYPVSQKSVQDLLAL